MRAMNRFSKYVVAFVTFLASCGEGEGFSPSRPPQTVPALEALWAGGEPAEFDPVDGVQVSREEIEFMQQFSPGESREELARKIGLRKALARRAVDKGLADDMGLAFHFQRALTHALIRLKFEKEHSPDSVPVETWKMVYGSRQVFPMFDHKDTFFVVDTQLICCSGQVHLCAADTHVQGCMQDYQPEIWEVYDILKEKQFDDTEELKTFVKDLGAGRFPRLRTQEYSFQYDFNAPRTRQIGYNVVNENIALGAKMASLRRVTEPIRSNHGWHVLYVTDFLPEIHKRFEDSEVQATLKDKFYPMVRRNDVMEYIGGLFEAGRLKSHEDAIRKINWAKVTGLE